MEIRHLNYFVAVAEELHFGKAANRLKITQPPLSKQIAQLEDEIGAKLLFRTKRRVELTEAGKHFLEQTYSILNRIEEASEDARNIHRGQSGKLKIGFTGLWTKRLLNLLQYYRSKYPQVEVVLHQMSTADQFKALKEKRIQIGVVCKPISSISSDTFTSILAHRVPFYAALSENHPLANNDEPIDLIKLKDQPFIMSVRKNEPSYYDTIISICHQSGFSPKILQEVEGVFTILNLVSADWGVTLVTKIALEYPSKGILFKEINNSETTIDIALVWRKDEDTPIVNTFTTIFKELFKTDMTEKPTMLTP